MSGRLELKGSSSCTAGISKRCGNCGSYVAIPDPLPYVTFDESSAGTANVEELIECGVCCTAWAISNSDGVDAELTVAHVQNEHRVDRSAKVRRRHLELVGDADRDDPVIVDAREALAAIAAAQHAAAEAVARAARDYSLRDLEELGLGKRSTLSRLARVGEKSLLPADIDDTPRAIAAGEEEIPF